MEKRERTELRGRGRGEVNLLQKNAYLDKLHDLARTDRTFSKEVSRLLRNSKYAGIAPEELCFEGFELARRYAKVNLEAYDRTVLEKKMPLFVVSDISKRIDYDWYVYSNIAAIMSEQEEFIPQV